MIIQERLKDILTYDKNTGEFTWNVNRKSAKTGDVAGSIYSNGYRVIKIDGIRAAAHRLAWLYIYGEYPELLIDHINGKKYDNRIDNLRLATHSQNSQNLKKAKSVNKLGVLGVSFDQKRNKFCSSIKVNGKSKHLGRYENCEDAQNAYLKAKREIHKFCTI